MKYLSLNFSKNSNLCYIDENEFYHLEFERIYRKKHFGLDELKLNETKNIIYNILADDSIISLVYTGNYLYRRIFNINNNNDLKVNYTFSDNKKSYLLNKEVYLVNHHLAHASYSYYTRPKNFINTDILSYDGFGTYTDKMFFNNKTLIDDSPFGLGFLWSYISEYLFKNHHEAGKVMGLSAYGEFNRKLVKVYKIFLRNFKKEVGEIEIYYRKNNKNDVLKKLKPTLIDKLDFFRHEDIAYNLQKLSENIVLKYLKKNKKNDYLCLSGGIALNGYINQLIVNSKLYKDVHIPPAVDDGGLSIGANLFAINKENDYIHDKNIAYIGNYFNFTSVNFVYYKDEELYKYVVRMLRNKKIIGWYQGRSESGPRALGNRSILADPTFKDMKDYINQRVKHRENFRPYAPMILEEDVTKWFEGCKRSPYMNRILKYKKGMGEKVPSVCHVDYTGRVQTVTEEDNKRIYLLLKEFKLETGIPILLNTSFNDREPIVDSPEDAIKTFESTNIDVLVIENYVLEKRNK